MTEGSGTLAKFSASGFDEMWDAAFLDALGKVQAAGVIDRVDDQIARTGRNRVGHGHFLGVSGTGGEIGGKAGEWQAGHAGNDDTARNHG